MYTSNMPAASLDLVPNLIAALSANQARARFACLKDLVGISRTQPEALYPHFDCFVRLLDSRNSIVRWNATRILANLSAADRESKIESILDKYLAPIQGTQMIGAAVTIQSAAAIALAKPQLADRIAGAILGVRRAHYQTEECRNVALGHAIQSFDRFFDLIRRKAPVELLVRAQLRNSRAGTRKKAEKFLKKHNRRVLGG